MRSLYTLAICDDFNIHINKVADQYARRFNELLVSFDLVDGGTHRAGNYVGFCQAQIPLRRLHRNFPVRESRHSGIWASSRVVTVCQHTAPSSRRTLCQTIRRRHDVCRLHRWLHCDDAAVKETGHVELHHVQLCVLRRTHYGR